MVGRALTFADPEILRMAREDFVPVACDDWYQRRREDAEGEFFRAVANQGPRRHAGVSGPTRQGIYLLTPGGELLGYRNHRDPDVMRGVLRGALAEWEARDDDAQLDIAPTFEPDPRYHRAPPEGALVVRTYTRELTRSPEGGYDRYGDRSPARGHLWILADEARALAAARPTLDPALLRRILRFHLVDATRGEPPFWSADEVTHGAVSLEVDDDRTTVRVSCTFELGDEERGFAGALEGTLTVNTEAGTVETLDWVAHGDHWGEGRWNRGAREGRAPLAIAFQFPFEGPAVPPQAARDLRGYLAPGR